MTGVGVRQRNLAMVYQQFINYPAMTVFDNIASPLKLQKTDAKQVAERVNEVAAKLHIEHLLQRRPGELSGGQQQRCALARALVKRSSLVLLDEPLVNLDYKLREELRAELATLFADGRTTVVYATTDPLEALLLGGYTAIVDKGRVLQVRPHARCLQRAGDGRCRRRLQRSADEHADERGHRRRHRAPADRHRRAGRAVLAGCGGKRRHLPHRHPAGRTLRLEPRTQQASSPCRAGSNSPN